MATTPSAADDVTVLRGDELHAVVAHDLRSPLTAIVGFGETMTDRWDELDDGLRRTLVGKMTAQARTLRAIAENLLSARAIDLRELDVAPAALLTDLVDRLQPLCGVHPLDLRVAPELPVVLVDRVRFLQVLVNLVG